MSVKLNSRSGSNEDVPSGIRLRLKHPHFEPGVKGQIITFVSSVKSEGLHNAPFLTTHSQNTRIGSVINWKAVSRRS